MTSEANSSAHEREDDGLGTAMWACITTGGFFIGVADAGAENLDLVPTLWGAAVPLLAWIAFCRERLWLEFLFLGASALSFVAWFATLN